MSFKVGDKVKIKSHITTDRFWSNVKNIPSGCRNQLGFIIGFMEQAGRTRVRVRFGEDIFSPCYGFEVKNLVIAKKKIG